MTLVACQVKEPHTWTSRATGCLLTIQMCWQRADRPNIDNVREFLKTKNMADRLIVNETPSVVVPKDAENYTNVDDIWIKKATWDAIAPSASDALAMVWNPDRQTWLVIRVDGQFEYFDFK